jgi:hypothetical protein
LAPQLEVLTDKRHSPSLMFPQIGSANSEHERRQIEPF